MVFSEGKNTLYFKPEGFNSNIKFTFPSGKLSVCEACKRNCKTKRQCRGSDGHNSLPTRETFMCLILDKSCTDELNKLKDIPFVAKQIPAQPCKALLDQLDCSLPVCTDCEKKNYSRAHCRVKKKHQDLPWTTTFFYLRAADSTVNYSSLNFGLMNEDKEIISSKRRRMEEPGKTSQEMAKPADDANGSETIHYVPSSRSYLARVSTAKNALNRIYLDPNVFSRLSMAMTGNQVATNLQSNHAETMATKMFEYFFRQSSISQISMLPSSSPPFDLSRNIYDLFNIPCVLPPYHDEYRKGSSSNYFKFDHTKSSRHDDNMISSKHSFLHSLPRASLNTLPSYEISNAYSSQRFHMLRNHLYDELYNELNILRRLTQTDDLDLALSHYV